VSWLSRNVTALPGHHPISPGGFPSLSESLQYCTSLTAACMGSAAQLAMHTIMASRFPKQVRINITKHSMQRYRCRHLQDAFGGEVKEAECTSSAVQTIAQRLSSRILVSTKRASIPMHVCPILPHVGCCYSHCVYYVFRHKFCSVALQVQKRSSISSTLHHKTVDFGRTQGSTVFSQTSKMMPLQGRSPHKSVGIRSASFRVYSGKSSDTLATIAVPALQE
jgi:hypothetical protein